MARPSHTKQKYNLNDLAIKTCLRPEINRNLQNYKQNSAKEMSENIFGQISDKRVMSEFLTGYFENMSEIKSAEIKLSEIVLSEFFVNNVCHLLVDFYRFELLHQCIQIIVLN